MCKIEEDKNRLQLGFLKTIQPNSFSNFKPLWFITQIMFARQAFLISRFNFWVDVKLHSE